MIILIKLFLHGKLDLIQTVKFVKQLLIIQIQKGGKVLLWNQVKSRMEACYSELMLCKIFWFFLKYILCLLKRKELYSFQNLCLKKTMSNYFKFYKRILYFKNLLNSFQTDFLFSVNNNKELSSLKLFD